MNRAEEYFVEIVRAGSLTKAAGKLYISQPSLTKYIQRLEKQVGVRLFDRSTNPMRINDAGRVYYEYLLDCLSAKERMMGKLDQITKLESGTLHLGMPSFCAQCYLSRVLPAFKEEYPNVGIELLEASGERLELALMEQQIDVAVLHLPVTNRELKHTKLFEERVLLAVPGSSGPEQVMEGDIRDFADMSFILPQPEQKLGLYTQAFFVERDIRPTVAMKTQNVTTMLSLAAQGMGAAFVPEGGLSSISRDILGRLDFYDLGGAPMAVAMLQRRESSLPTYGQRLIQMLRAEL